MVSGIFEEEPVRLIKSAEQPNPRAEIPNPTAEVFRNSRLVTPFRFLSILPSRYIIAG
jgi:hypothetical protein